MMKSLLAADDIQNLFKETIAEFMENGLVVTITEDRCGIDVNVKSTHALFRYVQYETIPPCSGG